MAKSVSGKIEWLASHGSLIRLDAISLGLAPEQTKPAATSGSPGVVRNMQDRQISTKQSYCMAEDRTQ